MSLSWPLLPPSKLHGSSDVLRSDGKRLRYNLVMKDEGNQITFGEQLKKFAVGGFILTETLHQPRVVLPRHQHERANINLTIKGSFRETIGNKPQECIPASLLVKPAGESHANRYGDQGARCLVIEVTPERLESIETSSRLFDAPAHTQGGRLSALAMRVYHELLTQDSVSPLMIEGLLLEILGHATRWSLKDSSPTPPFWLVEARELIHERFAESLSLSSVASSVGVHPAHLARVFRKHYRCSVGDYVRRLRLEFAAQELVRSNKSLAEIALTAGFYDQSQFSREFRRFMVMTPSEFRANLRLGSVNTKELRFSKTP